MRAALRQVLMGGRQPVIPATVKPSCLAWWDAGKRGDVWAGLTNLISNGNFAAGTAGWTGIDTVAGGVAEKTASAQHQSMYQSYGQYASLRGHKVYLRAAVKADSGQVELSIHDGANKTAANSSGTGMFEAKSVVHAIQADAGQVLFRVVDNRAGGWTKYYARDVIAVDLTAAFGAGNEPSATEMDAILAADGAAHWDGTRTVRANPDGRYFWPDYSGNARHMKLNNFGYVPGSGWQGDALIMDGVDDYAVHTGSPVSAANSSFSLMAVFDMYSMGSNIFWASATNGTSAQSLNIYHGSGGNVQVALKDSVAAAASPIVSTIVPGKHYIAASYDQTDRICRIYLDGALVYTFAPLPNGLNQIQYIKSGINTSGTVVSAVRMLCVAAFSRALTASEVSAICKNNKKRWGL